MQTIARVLSHHLASHTGSIEYKKILAAFISAKSNELNEKGNIKYYFFIFLKQKLKYFYKLNYFNENLPKSHTFLSKK